MSLNRNCWVAILSIWASAALVAQPSASAGKELFSANCAACHAKNMVTPATGPALAGVEDRWADFPRTDLYKWVRGSGAMVQAGHPRAKALFAEWKGVAMNNFPQLTDEQIESLLLYVQEASKPVVKVEDPRTAGGNEEKPLPWLYIGIAATLGLLVFAMIRIVNNLQNVTRTQAGGTPVYKTTWDIVSTRGFVAFTVFVVILFGGWKMVDNATKMGREQTYQPTQPINFSHKIHAGDYKIDCQYCHDGARRSKQSVIPATNTCMNCHRAVKTGTLTGTSEITKIYASIGFNPLENTYIPNYENVSDAVIDSIYKKWIGEQYLAKTKLNSLDESGVSAVENQWEGVVKALKNDSNGKIQGPIEWVRIHNLPDHVYFNHAQHVSVGKLECQKCHGKVEEMEEVYQYSTLGMGWCVTCHRETEVKFADNQFYKSYNQDFIKMHKQRTHKDEANLEKVFVEDIGGLECQKCHY